MAQRRSPNRAAAVISPADEAIVAAAPEAVDEALFRIARIGARTQGEAVRLGGDFGGAT